MSTDLAQIRARVADGAIDKVTRIYSSRPAPIFAELLQNARRGGATHVAVTAVPASTEDTATRVTVADDGAGIDDPSLLLSFGESGWDGDTARAEDPGGMGLLSLSRHGCTIRWRRPGENGDPGYRLDLEPDHFLGRKAAPVEPDDTAPSPHGTAVTFEIPVAQQNLRSCLAAAARHYPLPVTLGADTLERRAFLDGAVHTEKWRGIAFGVFEGRHRGFRDPDLNFHGLTLGAGLPQVHPVRGKTWTVRADIESCPELELVLPARREAVETPFLDAMREASRRAIYRAMAAADTAPCLAWKDWKRAADAGIDLPVPKPVLRPWRPGAADIDRSNEAPNLVSLGTLVGRLPCLVAADLEPPEAQTLYRAARRAGIADRLFDVQPGFEGYPWYDGLTRVEIAAIHVTMDGATHPLETLREPGRYRTPTRPESIAIHLHAVRPGGAPNEIIPVAADLAFAAEPGSWIEDADPLVTKDSELAPGDLATLIVDSCFCPSDDAESDSYATQRKEAEAHALHTATALLVSSDEARKRSIAAAVWRDILWLMPRDREVDIHVHGDHVDVTLGSSPART